MTLEEFIDGIMRCKGPARAIDQVAMHAELKQLDVPRSIYGLFVLREVVNTVFRRVSEKNPPNLLEVMYWQHQTNRKKEGHGENFHEFSWVWQFFVF